MNLKRFFKLFCENTTIHGFSYMGESRSRLIERLFWVISLLVSMILTISLILKLIASIKRNPIVIYTDDNAIAATDIVFPAMTICPSLRLGFGGFSGFDFMRISEDLRSGKIHLNDLSPQHLKYLQIVALITGDVTFFNSSEMTIPTHDIVDRLKDFPQHWADPFPHLPGNPPFPFTPQQKGNWRGNFEVNFTEILWTSGFCYTFNFAGADEVFNLEEVSEELNYTHIVSIAIETQNYYTQYNDEKPFKTHNYLLGLFAEFEQGPRNAQEGDWRNVFEDSHPSEILDGFHLIFHDPYELPSASSQQFYTLTDFSLQYLITPEMTSIDESLYDFTIEDRNCYLPDEKKLKFFKKYTKSNCEHECLANMTLAHCSCAQFYQVRRASSRLCGISDRSCFAAAKEKFLQTTSDCRCLEPCNFLKYDIEPKILYSINRFYRTYDRMLSTFTVKFGAKNYYELKRKQQFSNVEMLSFIGGLLGLFTGFSFISATELLYMIVKTSLKARSTSKVYPMTETTKRKPWIFDFLKTFLENSSIHSLIWIAKEKKIAQKIFWIFTFVFSIFGCELMATRMYGKLKSDAIIQTQDGNMRSVSSIPFPAVTVVDTTKEETMLMVDLVMGMSFGFAFQTPTEEEFYKALKGYPFSLLNATVDSLLCNDGTGHFLLTVDYLNFTFDKPSALMEHLKRWVPQRSWFEAANITWNKKFRPFFTETLTSQGIGFSFNLIESKYLLNEKDVSEDFSYVTPANYSLLSTLLSSEQELSMSFEYRDPRDWFESGTPNIFGIPKFQFCKHAALLVHSPYQLPSNFEYLEFTRMKFGTAMEILITPQVVETDESLRSFPVSTRQCYFEGERLLNFFDFYSRENCLAECISLAMTIYCGCVPFYSIRNKTMDICAVPKRDCAAYVKSIVLDQDHCDCLPLCNTITYEIEVRKLAFSDPSFVNKTTIMIRFKEEGFYAVRRYQQFTIQDFLSNIGGLLGLFAGISCLSIVEVVFFFTLRLINDIVRLHRSRYPSQTI